MLYPFFDVIPKSKIPSIHYKMIETTDLKWIDGREVALRWMAAWVWGWSVAWDGWWVSDVELRWWRRWRWVELTAINRVSLRDQSWERWAWEMRWEWAWERWLQRWDERVERLELKRVMSFREMSFRVNEREREREREA